MNETDACADIAVMDVRQDAKTTALSIIADLFHQRVQVDRVFLRERGFYGEWGFIVIGVSVDDVDGTVTVADTDGCPLELSVTGGVTPNIAMSMCEWNGMERDEQFAVNAVKLLRAIESLA